MKEHTLALSNYMMRYWEHHPTTPQATLVVVHGFRGDHHGFREVGGDTALYSDPDDPQDFRQSVQKLLDPEI